MISNESLGTGFGLGLLGLRGDERDEDERPDGHELGSEGKAWQPEHIIISGPRAGP